MSVLNLTYSGISLIVVSWNFLLSKVQNDYQFLSRTHIELRNIGKHNLNISECITYLRISHHLQTLPRIMPWKNRTKWGRRRCDFLLSFHFLIWCHIHTDSFNLNFFSVCSQKLCIFLTFGHCFKIMSLENSKFLTFMAKVISLSFF